MANLLSSLNEPLIVEKVMKLTLHKKIAVLLYLENKHN